MREIKFRGKSALDYDNKWIYGGILYFCGRPQITYETDCFVSRIGIIPETLGQYTGLHDSTEQEVYEGDILSDARGRLYVIVWRAGGPCVYSADEYRDLCRRAPYTLHDALADRQVSDYVQEGLTVVGNIHDDAELLTPKDN